MEKFQEHLSVYRRLFAELEVPTVFVGPQPIDESKPSRTGYIIEDDMVEAFGEAIQQEAATAHMPYVDTRALFLDRGLEYVMHEDGRHPNALGHAILHQAIEEALLSVGALPPDFRNT